MKTINNDNIILAQIRQGDRQAFELLFKKYFARLCCFADNITRSNALAKEAVQQVFINIWEKKDKLYVETSLIAYLVTATKNNALNLVKKNKIRTSYEQDYAREHQRTQQKTESYFENEHLTQLVGEGIAQLPDRCREIYTLSKKEGLTYGEISEHLMISSKTVENQMGIAMKKLREYLKIHLETIL